MGIQGLLPLLKSIHKPCNLKTFEGQTIGVDAYGWLHRGTVSCAIELAQDKPTTKFVDFAMSRVRMLHHFGIKPYLVFDGDYLPSKAGTERERAARRDESKTLGLQLLSMGKTAQAHSELQKAVDVTPEMARQLIEELKRARVEYVVAPYEADPQLAYLERKGIIDAILSEDSDLLVFGARCLLTKLDQYGDCIMIRRDDFTACREVSLVGWSDNDFRRMAIMSGCDYLAGINKMGLKTAYRLLRKHKTIERAIRAAQFDGKVRVPAGYLEAFEQAERTFVYPWVYCPLTEQLVNLTEPDSAVDIACMPYIGNYIDAGIASKVARGDLHPHTKQLIVVKAKARAGPNTPAAVTKKQKSLVVDSDPKKTQSIRQYFKRTPLQELDPNSVSYSPSQQRLLQENRGSWSAQAAPLQSRVSHSTSATFSAPSAARRTNSAPLKSGSSLPHPAKRQRLCSDTTGTTTVSANGETVASPFFMSNGSDPSPSGSRATTGRRSKERAFNLWSDDSIDEEVMASLADASFHSAAPGKPKIKVFADNVVSEDRAFSRCVVAKAAYVSDEAALGFTASQTGSSEAIRSRSAQSNQAVAENETPFDAQLSSEITALRKKYAYSGPNYSKGPKLDPKRSPQKSPQSPLRRSQSVVPRFPSSPLKPNQNDLNHATNPFSQNSHEPLIPRSPPPAPCPGPLPPSEPEPDIETAQWLAMESSVYHHPTYPTKHPLAPSNVPTNESIPQSSVEAVKGSEDFLVGDSEGEAEAEAEAEAEEDGEGRGVGEGEDGESGGGRVLDLRRFAFAFAFAGG